MKMLKTVRCSQVGSKLGGIAATYRSGGNANKYGTCPDSCPLKASHHKGTSEIDTEYLSVLADAAPKRGLSWTYTHFKNPQLPGGKTIINLSADNLDMADDIIRSGRPTVVTTPFQQDPAKVIHTKSGVRVVRCPAYYSKVDCRTCGSGHPLCARGDRDYIISFTAHGAQKQLVTSEEKRGGCYAGSWGNINFIWTKMSKQTNQLTTDGEVLHDFVRSLPAGSMIRHHVAGDIGRDI